jgi:diacylglycerol O-acyltransferase / wax synthase
MIHLSGVDASFLHMETPEMPMHVGSLHLFELPEDYRGDFYEDVVKHVSARMHLATVFERKLAQMPFEMSNPVWVDDDDIDIEYHIRRVVLSKPGTMRQLEQYAGRLHSSLLDRSRPLWEMYVFEGLQSGQVGMYVKVHHAAIDGQAGVALAKALYDVTPEPRQVRPPRARQKSNQYQLGVAELATAAMQNTVQQYVKLITTLPNAMRAMASVAMPALGQLGKMPQLQLPSLIPSLIPSLTQPNFGLPNVMDGNFGLPNAMGFGPRTPLNVSITNQRSFAGRSVPLAETKALAKRMGVSLNDVVMAACAGALRRYMADLNVTLDRPMTAAVPVSLREAGNTDPNNQVTMMLASLATDIKDPLERLKAINASTKSSKELTGNLKAAIPTDFPSFGAPWIMTGLATLFGRSKISDQIPPVANVAISNVPGVPVPLYLAGAKMSSYFPVSIPAHGCALNITVQSYNNALDYGLTACRRAVPDVEEIANYIVAAHAELQKQVLALDASATKGEVKVAPASAVAHAVPSSPVLPSHAAPQLVNAAPLNTAQPVPLTVERPAASAKTRTSARAPVYAQTNGNGTAKSRPKKIAAAAVEIDNVVRSPAKTSKAKVSKAKAWKAAAKSGAETTKPSMARVAAKSKPTPATGVRSGTSVIPDISISKRKSQPK